MTERDVYEKAFPVKRIVDAYAAVLPWGGLSIDRGGGAERVEFDAALVVRGLLIEGEVAAEVRVGSDTKTVPFDFTEDEFGSRRLTRVGVVASVAEALARLRDAAPIPGLDAYAEQLMSSIETGLALPLWVLEQPKIDKADPVALKWALFYFTATCERYRQAIAYDVRQAFGGMPVWVENLYEPEAGIFEHSRIYRAFCESLGLQLSPIRSDCCGESSHTSRNGHPRGRRAY